MPTYTYQCEKKHQEDLVHSMLTEPLPKCRKCKADMRRVPKNIKVTFKGSGFASTDK
jgi:putative FmdB family regulatory protein